MMAEVRVDRGRVMRWISRFASLRVFVDCHALSLQATAQAKRAAPVGATMLYGKPIVPCYPDDRLID
jgi:hypothetical protein